MFTGIVKGAFPVKWVERKQDLIRYAIELPPHLLQELEVGASISVDGVCQSVTLIQDQRVYFDAITETLQRTTLNSLTVNQLVNIERAARFGDEIGGHLLSGHIFGKGSIAQIDQGHWKIDCPQEWLKYILEKGFIAIDGVSLTIGRVDLEGFFIHLIPETLKTTTFSSKKIGDEVNIELDHQTQAIVDTVERLINQRYPK